MVWTPDIVNLLLIGWLSWLLWGLLALLFWNMTIAGAWDRVPKPLFRFEKAARKRNNFVHHLELSAVAEETAVVLEARDRWLAWRYLGVWFPGLLISFLPLTFIMFFSSPAESGGPTTSVLERLPAAAGLTAVAVLPLALTGLAYGLSATRLSPTWSSDAEVWRHLRNALRDALRGESGSAWRGSSLRSARSLRLLAAALERDFMRTDDVTDPALLRRSRREAVGAVLDHRDWITHQPNRGIDKELAIRFAGHWLAGDWNQLHRGEVRDRPASRQPGERPERRGVTIAAIIVYLVLASAALFWHYENQETRLSIIVALLVPLLGPLVLAVLESRRRPPGSRS